MSHQKVQMIIKNVIMEVQQIVAARQINLLDKNSKTNLAFLSCLVL